MNARHRSLRILIADDHPVFRQGLRQVVEAEPAFKVSHEAGDGLTALDLIRAGKPDICVLDIKMPGLSGLAIVRHMREERMASKVIFLTMYHEKDIFNEAMELKVKGYVLKESAVIDILCSIHTVAAGHHYISPALSDLVFARSEGLQSLRREKPGLERLTLAERRILKMIAEDRTSKEIAASLGLSVRTIENHRANISARLNLQGTHSLLRFAFAHRSEL
jgi:DNA-binding NarL/FixJ family response regulator